MKKLMARAKNGTYTTKIHISMLNSKNIYNIPRNKPLPAKLTGLLECVPTYPSAAPGYVQLSGPGR